MRAGLGSGLRKDPAGAGIGAAGEVEGQGIGLLLVSALNVNIINNTNINDMLSQIAWCVRVVLCMFMLRYNRIGE